jgi:hypothetical protein
MSQVVNGHRDNWVFALAIAFAFAFAITKPKGRSSRSARKKPVIEKSLSGSATVDGSVPINGLGGN